MNLDSELVCECGRRFDAFSFLVKLGYEREALIVDFKSFEPDVAAIIPRLACKNCGKRGGRYHLYKAASQTPITRKEGSI